MTRTPRGGIAILSQDVRLRDSRHHRVHPLDLEQHVSANEGTGAGKVLDNVATAWFCLTAETGKHYLWLFFNCSNYDATSCKYDYEEARLYDETGHDLNIGELTHEQHVKLYKRLELPTKLPDGGYITDKHNVFW